MTVKQRTTYCIFTHKFNVPVYHSDLCFFNITSVFNISQASCLQMLCMQNGYWRHISTVFVSYIQRKPCYVYSCNVASGIGSIHHLTCLLIFLSQSWYRKDRKMPTTGHLSQQHTLASISLSALLRISTSSFGIFKNQFWLSCYRGTVQKLLRYFMTQLDGNL